jgi:uncharacterized protein (TIGR02231 family)
VTDATTSLQTTAARLIQAPIDAVLVMEDRAQVTRRARLELDAGSHVLRCTGVTPVVADRTLRCRVRRGGDESSPGPRVLELRVRRDYVVRTAQPEAVKELTATIEALVDEYAEVNDRMRTLHHERGQLEIALQRLTRQISERLAVGPFEPAWADESEQVFERRTTLETDLLADQWQQDERRERIDRLLEERQAAVQPITEYIAEIQTDLAVESAATYELEWEYLVPCALWRPEYLAELDRGNGNARVRWRSGGTVWQLTGEAWLDVELSLSTARPTLGADLPLLSDDVLRSRDKTEEEKKTIEVTSRDEVIAKTSTAPDAAKSDTPPGLDDGGEARTYRVPERVNVPSDGRPHRLELEAWEADAQTELLCIPERELFVFLESLQTNPSGMPLLAGPVALIRDGGYIGRSDIRYVAPRERFALSWGSEDGLVVLRDVAREYEETGLRKTRHHKFDLQIYLANQTGEAQRLRVAERVPVAEIEKVDVELDAQKTTGGFTSDEHGIVSWQVDLAAGQDRKLSLAFEVRMPQDVVWHG